MIDFRYHIVSIVAVFLALGLGVLAGTTVLDRVTVEALEGRVDDLRNRLNQHREEITNLRAERDRAGSLLGALAPRVTEGVLDGMPLVFVTGDEDADWHGSVRGALAEAGAQDVGALTLTSRWRLEEEGDREELQAAFGERPLDGSDDAADAALQVGEMLVGGDADGIVARLVESGFIRLSPAEGVGTFPPRNAHVVVFCSPGEAPLAPIARGAARVTPTLALSPSVEDLGALEDLRGIEDLPARLSTFDSADGDPAGVGSVLALRAAADGAGGHFGRGPRLGYLPAPP